MRSALPALVYLFLTLLAIPVLLVCVLFGLRDVFLAYGRWMMRVGRCILGIDVEATGLGAATPYVFISNHLSFLDGPLLMTVLDRPARVLIVLPYVPDVAKAWVDVLPEQLDKVKGRKYPADPTKLDEKGKQSMERFRGPAGIRLSVQGPGCPERDEVSARANVCVLLHSWPPRGVAPFHPAMTISRQVCSEDPDARFACRGFIIIAHTCIGFL